MEHQKQSENYIDIICDIRRIECIIACLNELIDQWKYINDIKKLELWTDLQIDYLYRLVSEHYRSVKKKSSLKANSDM